MLFLTAPSTIGSWLGLEATLLYRGIGLALVLFSLDLVHQATRPRLTTWRAVVSSVADFMWAIGSFALLVVAPPSMFSDLGGTLIASIAVVVLIFGVWQWRAIERLYRVPGAAEHAHRVCILVEVDATPEAMWRVISDLRSIHRYLPTLARVTVNGEPAVGAMRTCEDRSGRRWSEECIAFSSEERRFAVRFVCEAPDFPFPTQRMCGGWAVEPAAAGSQIMVWWEFTLRPRVPAPVVLALLARQAEVDFPKVIARMAAAAHAPSGPTLEADAAPTRVPVEARLLPRLC